MTASGKTFGLPDVKLPREVPIVKHRFTDYFIGFEKLPVVREIFGSEADRVLAALKVEFSGGRFGYMGTSDEDGHLIISAHYIKEGDSRSIYLDVIHELVHVRQFLEGKELFDDRFSYVERPTELEAYRVAVDEAKRLGLNDERICRYLKTEWMSDEELGRLAKAMNVKCRLPQEENKPKVRSRRQ